MAAFPEFLGGFYQTLFPIAGVDQAINIYTETREVPGSGKQVAAYGTPGLDLYASAATNACRGNFSQDGQTWTVIGDQLYPVNTTTGTLGVSLGTILDDGFPVSWASNGKGGDQLGIVGGGELKVLNLLTNVLSAAIVLPFSNPVMIVFQDGYGLINEANSPIVWFSALEDFTSFDGLDFFARSGSSDNIVALAQTRDRVLTIGSATTTQFYDSGDADTPWLPYPGTTTQIGIITPWALTVYGDVLRWIGIRAKDTACVVQMNSDGQPQIISTPPIERFLSRCTTLANAEALTYGADKHAFTVFTCPSSPDAVQTYAWDEKEQLWAARAGWDSTQGVYTRWRARGCTSIGQEILVGDYANGNLYTLNPTKYTDNGEVLMRERIAPYLGNTPQWAFLDQVQLLAQTGVGLPEGQGSDPQVELLISRDFSQTWISAGLAPLGALGDYLVRTIWRQLGRARQDLLVIRVRQSDPVALAWTGMDLAFTPGTGQL